MASDEEEVEMPRVVEAEEQIEEGRMVHSSQSDGTKKLRREVKGGSQPMFLLYVVLLGKSNWHFIRSLSLTNISKNV